jgi:DNA topoisomerase I
MRLRRSDPSKPGFGRRRRGKGFSYVDEYGRPLTDPVAIERITALVIPPAWRDVWISPDPRGHIQATGTDQAGRRQYRYHDVWRAKRDEAKFDHVLDVAERLPRLRKKVAADLQLRGYGRERVLAVAVRLLDEGVFRIGGEQYATEDAAGGATFGLATVHRDHVSVRGAVMEFRYPAKGGTEQAQRIIDGPAAKVVKTLVNRDDDGEELLAYRNGQGWRDIRSVDVNEYLRAAAGCDISAKDFRTWHATVLAAVLLADFDRASAHARKRAVSSTMREVSEYLGNTPAVARASYVDPRVVDLFHDGVTVQVKSGKPAAAAERAVLAMLRAEASA